MPYASVAVGASPIDNNVAQDFKVEKIDTLSFKTSEVLVKYKADTDLSEQAQVKKSVGVKRILKTIDVKKSSDIFLYELKNGVSVNEAIKFLKNSGKVVKAEANYIRKSSFIPNDPSFNLQWGLNNVGQEIDGWSGEPDADIDAPEAWDIEQGLSNPVKVAVLDSGVDSTHPDLNGQVVDGQNFAGISQYSINLMGSIGYSATNKGVAQSIKGTGQNLTHIGLALKRIGNPTSDITVSVRSSLDGTDLASFTISSSEISSTSIVEIYKSLSSEVNLVSGTTYYMVARTDNSSSSDYYYVGYNGKYLGGNLAQNYYPDPYRDGNNHTWNGSTWTNISTDDLYFHTNANTQPKDDNGHGTHVSGIVAASTNNDIGVSGVSPNADILPVKVMDSSGGATSSDIIAGINYAVNNGAKVINMSFGGTEYSSLEQDAVSNAYNQGVILLAAVGNDGDTTVNYPAGYSNVVGVAATDNIDEVAWFSNYNSTVDISAPGQDILSTMPTYLVAANSFGDALNYEFESGTSMAAPMAAGVAALIRSHAPGLTPQQVQQTIQQNVDDLGDDGWDSDFGYGRINAKKALNALSPNQAPTATIDSIAPNPASQGQSVAFDGHGADTDGTITEYNWRSSIDGQFSTAQSLNKSNLSVGTHTVYFKVRDNDGVWSEETSALLTVNALPPNQAPTAAIDSITPNPAIQGENVSFTGHGLDNDGTISSYSWRSSLDGQLSTSTIFNKSNLSVGAHTIYFKVQDNNGEWSDEVSMPLTVNPAPGSPPAPVILSTLLSLKVSPKTIYKGKAVTVKGQLKKSNGAPVAGKYVIVKANGHRIKKIKTNSGGVFKFKHKPKKTTKYTAYYSGDTSFQATKSKAAKVVVKKKPKKKKRR